MISPSFDDWFNEGELEGPPVPEKFWFLCSNNKESAVIHAAYHEDSIKMWSEGGKWTSRSGGGCKTKEELFKANQILEDCSECHTPYFQTTYYGGEVLKTQHICFSCNFWREKLEVKDNESVFRIKGEHYCLGEKGGFGGRKFTIRKFNSEKVIETDRLWTQGAIPEHFRERLPDNAEFIETPKAIGHGQGYLQTW